MGEAVVVEEVAESPHACPEAAEVGVEYHRMMTLAVVEVVVEVAVSIRASLEAEAVAAGEEAEEQTLLHSVEHLGLNEILLCLVKLTMREDYPPRYLQDRLSR